MCVWKRDGLDDRFWSETTGVRVHDDVPWVVAVSHVRKRCTEVCCNLQGLDSSNPVMSPDPSVSPDKRFASGSGDCGRASGNPGPGMANRCLRLQDPK